ncbi:hypothetical protein HC031_01565 [Planosporangium thailandense]|uniref:DUF222 domain-containing protein n=1 Tax=Planosporangium thailandense TaxID=765197 RepID=A0ABX0XR03_9ACTN|nr:hypothetical protein [Planosporangium thailandense]NJC68416.1 hypothetical protein [Planosporangium thailandense]
MEQLTSQISDHAAQLSPDEWRLVDDAYECALAHAERAGTSDRIRSAERRLNLTTVVLRLVPPDDIIGLRSWARFADTFRDAVPMSAAAADAIVDQWAGLDVTEIRRLRDAKNLLTPVLRVKEHLVDRAELELDTWERVYPRLP